VAALEALWKLINCGVAEKKLETQYQLIGHRQNTASKTECPGNQLFQEVTSWPHWTPDPKSFNGVQTVPKERNPDLVPGENNGLGQSVPGGKAPTLSAELFISFALTVIVIIKQ
jgi:hypothetical protein